jgi:invasion protein IalB
VVVVELASRAAVASLSWAATCLPPLSGVGPSAPPQTQSPDSPAPAVRHQHQPWMIMVMDDDIHGSTPISIQYCTYVR